MYLKYVNDFPSINEYMHFCSKWSINTQVGGTQIVPIQPLIYRKCFELNIKSFKVRMSTKNVVITFVAIVFFVKFL